ncbi:hypothetical protein DICPUDRAFT_148023 [Dictyostelium purpureum]|uniref:Uncharacterized protein n=1 Tax=Dictyostelium purpureum TaxID=5786 RepID=F0ZA17_DICPU|nr:uncharacterized protein DICPUDRAFT_148023 [Dictyostelium purpureum]EGC39246.1 hypothetical protein DICPUDRAFT_148023 [Dictyostelium purpureum]|eukprot:XP_003284273.1 hypothetical protein DICPUDRAFT_148023 [Dictyostelium purpureum]
MLIYRQRSDYLQVIELISIGYRWSFGLDPGIRTIIVFVVDEMFSFGKTPMSTFKTTPEKWVLKILQKNFRLFKNNLFESKNNYLKQKKFIHPTNKVPVTFQHKISNTIEEYRWSFGLNPGIRNIITVVDEMFSISKTSNSTFNISTKTYSREMGVSNYSKEILEMTKENNLLDFINNFPKLKPISNFKNFKSRRSQIVQSRFDRNFKKFVKDSDPHKFKSLKDLQSCGKIENWKDHVDIYCGTGSNTLVKGSPISFLNHLEKD